MKIEDVIKIVANYKPNLMEETPQSAAVLVLILVDFQQNLFFLLTKRSNHLASYAGQYSFSGGIKESNDQDLLNTAIREVKEELGLDQRNYQLIGQLDDFQARYGNVVRPFVATMPKEQFEKIVRIEQDEIESIYYLPLPELSNIQEDPTLVPITRRRPSYSYKNDDAFVWGLTASILVFLDNLLFNQERPIGKKIIS